MHPLRLILVISLAVATAFATAFGYALRAAGVHVLASVVLGVTSFVAFLVPWSAVFACDRVVTMFGVPAPIVGKSFLEVVRMQPLADAFEKALRGESSAARFTRDDRQIEMRVMPVSASTEVAAVALFIDISQLEKL